MTEQPKRPRGRRALTMVVLLVLTGVGAGAGAVYTGGVTFSWAGAGQGPATPATSTPVGRPTPSPTPTRPPAGPVLAPLTGRSEVPTRAGLERALAAAIGPVNLGPHASVAVRDLGTGRLLYGKDPAGAYIPASTTKILTSAAVLAVLGPEHRFRTTVVAGAVPGEIVLVGGGDPLLATAAARARATDATRGTGVPVTIEDLAVRTARQLRASGTTQVTVRVDDTLFREPVSPTWESQYVPTGVVGPVSALWVDEAKVSWPSHRPRAADPAMTAAQAYLQMLRKAGITVRGELARSKAPAKARELAAVSSPPLADIVEHVLLVSDNDGAEVLARHVAVAERRPATFAGAGEAIKAVLSRLGVEGLSGIKLYDGSGLSRDNRISADVLTQTLAAAARPEFPDLRAVVTGLPVAGYTGSLDDRFAGDASAPGVGIVRAKTGTLSAVSSLAGVVTTKDGALLAFAVMSDQARQNDPRPSIDQAASALASCGCR
ncbi:D-alanyl-D-alanine carboxypeptidase/D-alanyl-D-alanine-endopeptidase [Actinopolymorpha sp. B9G3]|uniref:D-alanyl-D-alanine carboxypeptidase/D-alanyl-D-alanine endopeptidase n=1 Tax=Actinopolymorpha sp. B9G3 TaxID=3158970 RepID=UPI0032D9861B